MRINSPTSHRSPRGALEGLNYIWNDNYHLYLNGYAGTTKPFDCWRVKILDIKNSTSKEWNYFSQGKTE
jgi:hypothetical protein